MSANSIALWIWGENIIYYESPPVHLYIANLKVSLEGALQVKRDAYATNSAD